MNTKPKCGSGYCRLQSTDKGVESCPTDKSGECQYREMATERTCGNCFNKVDCIKETPITDFDTCNDWQISHWALIAEHEKLNQEIETLKSQLARYSRHPFDRGNRETWPPEKELVLIFDPDNLYHYHAAYWSENWMGWADERGCIIQNLKAKWWSHLPG